MLWRRGSLKVFHSAHHSDKQCILKTMLTNLCVNLHTHIMNHLPCRRAAGVGYVLVAQKQIAQGSQLPKLSLPWALMGRWDFSASCQPSNVQEGPYPRNVLISISACHLAHCSAVCAVSAAAGVLRVDQGKKYLKIALHNSSGLRILTTL